MPERCRGRRWTCPEVESALLFAQCLAPRGPQQPLSKGFSVGERSVDRTSAPYEVARGAFYDGRVEAPWHEKATSEWTRRYDWIQMLSRVSPSTK